MRARSAAVPLLVVLMAIPGFGFGQSTGPAPSDGHRDSTRERAPYTDSRAATPDTLDLLDLRASARERDPRQRQIALQSTLDRIEDHTIDARWYPRLGASAEVSYQTEVPEVGGALSGSEDLERAVPSTGGPSGSIPSVPEPPRDQYQLAVEVSQLVWDGGRGSRRRALSDARLAEERAALESSLHGVEAAVDRAFFGVLGAQEQRSQLEVLETDLRERVRLVENRARGGAALSADTASIRAELIEVRQEIASAESRRRAALFLLEDLTGRSVESGDLLVVPSVTSAARRVERALERSEVEPVHSPPVPDALNDSESLQDDGSVRPDSLIARPELERLRRTEERLRAEARLAGVGDRPRVQTFIRGALARPGLDFFDDSFGPHAVAGLRLTWSIWNWGETDRESRSLRVRARIAATERASVTEKIRRETFDLLAEIDRLREAVEEDRRLLELRASVAVTARAQLERGVIVAADYVDRRTDLYRARLRLRRHRLELTENRVRLLRVVGRSVGTASGTDVQISIVSPRVSPSASDSLDTSSP